MSIKKFLPLIGIAIFFYILLSLDKNSVIGVFSSIQPVYLAISFILILPIVLITNFEWQIILRKQKIHVGNWNSIKNIFIGYFYGFITPGGFGAYVRTIYLKNKANTSLQKCVSNVLILNSIDYLSLLLIALVGGLVYTSRFPYLFLTIGVLLILLSILFLIALKKELVFRLFKKFLDKRIIFQFGEKYHLSIEKFYDDIPKASELLYPFVISVLGWILRFSELYLITYLFNISIPYMYFILGIAIANVVASLPITIYGLGTRELTMISLFSIFLIASEKIVALSLFWFVIIWITPSIIGGIFAFFEGPGKIKEFTVKENL